MIAERFRLLRMIGQGGFAVVFEARDEKLEQHVAVKVLKAPQDTGFRQEQLDRFEREAKLAARIPHPAIIRTIDVGQWNSIPYIVMEKLEGHPLAKEIWQSGAMEHVRARELMSGALHALAAAHEQGVIHRDLKPSNLFLTHPGERMESLKILDFGIAFHFSFLDDRLTGTEEILGTPSFISPEYAKSRLISPSLDVYQMGLVLAEMLHGDRLVKRSRWECYLADELWQPIELPHALLSGPFGEVLQKSLEQDHEQRYPNAQAMLDDLERLDLTPAPLAVYQDTPRASAELLAQRSAPTPTFEAPPEPTHEPSLEPTHEASLEPTREVIPDTTRQLALAPDNRQLAIIVGLVAAICLTISLPVVVFIVQTLQADEQGSGEFSAASRSTPAPGDASSREVVNEAHEEALKDQPPAREDEASDPAKEDAAKPVEPGARERDVVEEEPLKKREAPRTSQPDATTRAKKKRKPTPDSSVVSPEAPSKSPDRETQEAIDWLKSSD